MRERGLLDQRGGAGRGVLWEQAAAFTSREMSHLRGNSRAKILTIVGAVLAVALVTFRTSPERAALFGPGSVGEQMPAFSLKTLDGGSVTQDDMRGKVVLVNFWASWCGPCRTEMPSFQRVYQERKDQGLVVLGVWTDDTDAFAMREFLRDAAITYPVVIGGKDAERTFGGVFGLPTSLFIDRGGRIRQRVVGVVAEQTLRMQLDTLLAERAPPPPARRP